LRRSLGYGVAMATLVLISMLILQVAAPGEMSCLGFIKDGPAAMDLFIAGTEEDELTNYAHTGTLIYVNGPGVAALQPGQLYAIVRPEGKVRDQLTGEMIGVYHKEVGAARIETVRPDGASATVVNSCHVILKGDILVPAKAKEAVRFDGRPSDRLTPFDNQNLMATVVLGKDGIREMGQGHFCFIALGSRDGVRPGDRFAIYRPQPPFSSDVLAADGSGDGLAYEKVASGRYRLQLIDVLQKRRVPPRVLGDLVVLEVSETTAAAKIISSMVEVHVGDIVVRR